MADRSATLVFDTPAEVAAHVGRVITRTLAHAPDSVLGLATGATMVPVYAWLREAVRQRRLSFARASSFNLDEYAGLDATRPSSFSATMRAELFAHADFAPGRTHVPDGAAADVGAEAARYEAAVRASGGISLQLLGIGRNGHIGFNEPGSSFDSETRVVTLSEATRTANRGCFPTKQDVPHLAITMGIGTILRARTILLLATGAAKAAPVAAAWAGPRGPACPASALQGHPEVYFACDREAAAGINTACWTRSMEQ